MRPIHLTARCRACGTSWTETEERGEAPPYDRCDPCRLFVARRCSDAPARRCPGCRGPTRRWWARRCPGCGGRIRLEERLGHPY